MNTSNVSKHVNLYNPVRRMEMAPRALHPSTCWEAPRRGVPRHRENAAAAVAAAKNKAVVVSCEGLRLRTGEEVVIDDLWFEVRAGEVYGLVDPEGVSKTAVVRMVSGLLKPDDGAIVVQGQPIDGLDLQSLKESLGYVAQTAVTVRAGTITDNLSFWARLAGFTRTQRNDRISEVLAQTGLETFRAMPVDQCPGGVLRLLSLAVALLHWPRLLVLDEPTLGIDQQSRERLLTILGRLREQGMAVLYACRNGEEVRHLADRLGVIYQGHLVSAKSFTLENK